MPGLPWIGKLPIILFLFPGKSFARCFLESWTETLNSLNRMGITVKFRCMYSADIYACRNGLLQAGDAKPWPEVMPFEGKVEYDYLMWIDSDMAWQPDDVVRLLNHRKDIVSGVCPMGDKQDRAAYGWYAERADGVQVMRYATVKGSADMQELIEVDFAGFGFVMIKRGVFEAVGYPWFREVVRQEGYTKLRTSEDIGLCTRARMAGYKVWVDPLVRIGHLREVLVKA